MQNDKNKDNIGDKNKDKNLGNEVNRKPSTGDVGNTGRTIGNERGKSGSEGFEGSTGNISGSGIDRKENIESDVERPLKDKNSDIERDR